MEATSGKMGVWGGRFQEKLEKNCPQIKYVATLSQSCILRKDASRTVTARSKICYLRIIEMHSSVYMLGSCIRSVKSHACLWKVQKCVPKREVIHTMIWVAATKLLQSPSFGQHAQFNKVLHHHTPLRSLPSLYSAPLACAHTECFSQKGSARSFTEPELGITHTWKEIRARLWN